MNYEELIKNFLHRSLTVLQNDPQPLAHWRSHLLSEWIGETLLAIEPEACIDFIRDHKECGFVYYDAFGKVCGKPREFAAYLLTEVELIRIIPSASIQTLKSPRQPFHVCRPPLAKGAAKAQPSGGFARRGKATGVRVIRHLVKELIDEAP
jgi:hypothetical protein